MKNLHPDKIRAFQDEVMEWWEENARDLPWRRDTSPYNVLVSEMMLQQTQVCRVIPKFLEFIDVFPTLESLGDADIKSVLQLWSGLGYNRRALWLRDAARAIIERGGFPEEVEELEELKGIGPYTSRSILIFAFNKDIATIDTNIRRVFIASGFADECMTKSELQEVGERLLLRGRSRDWHNALMDYGSDVLTSAATGVRAVSQQTQYEGSSRQLRGAVVRILSESHPLTIQELADNVDCDLRNLDDLRKGLAALIDEGLVEKTSEECFRIPR
jgi:A/G-specific adenine glycosylase